MLNFDLNRMLYTLKPSEHNPLAVSEILSSHPEVKFVSLTGVDMGGHNTDEKIPVGAFIKDIDKLLRDGVQTDGSSVALPGIADLSNARVDIMPDSDVNWYVEYNYGNIDYETGLPTGTLRIPSFLRHNGVDMVGSRTYLRQAVDCFKTGLMDALREHPYVFAHTGGMAEIVSVDDIDELLLTNATELEFWVKTPDDRADRNQLSIAQELKEQYWKRVTGPVGTAMEQTIEILEHYGFGVEMGHKEVGGVKAKMGNTGSFDHIMEQLEIDWKYSNPMQAADNEEQVKNIVKDVFRMNNLDVTFRAKPMHGVAGSGEHTHFGVSARLTDGNIINLFEPVHRDDEFMSPIGFGALMGILKNYELLNPIVAPTHDAFQRLKPGYEAPVCIVTSLGVDHMTQSRNRTVLIGLVRDRNNPLSTRFELRSPNPHSNTYLIIGATYLTMLDGIRAALGASKVSAELEKSISKGYGVPDFYLDTNREYRSERNIYTDYTREERERSFGVPPANVWQCFKAWSVGEYNEPDFDPVGRVGIIAAERACSEQACNAAAKQTKSCGAGSRNVLKRILASYRSQMIYKWTMEYHERYILNTMEFLHDCKKLHIDDSNEYDLNNWKAICALKDEIGRESGDRVSLLMQARQAIDCENYDELSRLEILIEEKLDELRELYTKYSRNIF